MNRTREQGFSLIEVIMALGLLAAALISIAGLCVLGSRSVNSGRNATEALVVAHSILETMDGWGFRQTYGEFGFDGSTRSYVVDTRSSTVAAPWQAALDARLLNAWAQIDLDSLGPGTPPALASTRAIGVTVTVNWDEGPRSRRIRLGAVRM